MYYEDALELEFEPIFYYWRIKYVMARVAIRQLKPNIETTN